MIAYDGCLYIYGGQSNSTDNQSAIYCFNESLGAWSRVSSDGDEGPSLDSHSANFYENDGNPSMIVFGGYLSGMKAGKYSNSVYSFGFNDRKWRVLSTTASQDGKPHRRAGHAAQIIGSKLFIFGGNNEKRKFNDIWCFDLLRPGWSFIKGTWEPTDIPPVSS
jgi:N-acetylneuraminic acid mutarotase